ncbi:aldo/keto reductase [Paenibacillus qinlingensis]|uniref:Diketogulonate reductase-like aldo/keto reductase n=1 Tax=Paenibacillus qinlingensis TaxID=1837343 RepID=A0ABU1NYT1_9BACL|nr:aldo/keto reductase [Paenibacillus qinlingensis]MDR6552454.1 diketogulonate reductase-like aldo/keto reductase [Paenibacillus qinlingensis]
MTTNLQQTITLHNGVTMPYIGLGVFKVEDGPEVVQAVKAALKIGYRSIDTAAIYGNEASVGQGIREGLAENGLTRDQIFVTSKVWNADLGYESTLAAYEASLAKLDLDYLDLYLIHWPVKGKYVEAWRALETLYQAGRVKAIGVSNFQIHHLEDVIHTGTIKPMVNQVELHPLLTQTDVHDFCKVHGIQLEAWSPLMQGQLLDNPVLSVIAAKYGKSIAQVILRWDIQRGIVTIPKSTKEHRILENSSIFDFELTNEDMAAIDGMNQNLRVGPDPDNFDF